MKRLFALIVAASLTLVGCASDTKQSADIDLSLSTLADYGCSAEQINDISALLRNIGIVEFSNIEMQESGAGIVSIKGGSLIPPWNYELVSRIMVENGVVYNVHIYCPSGGLDGLADNRASLYDDTLGGYVNKIDWESKSVVPY